MRLLNVISAAILAPAVGLAAPAQEGALMTRENLCSLKAPPALCTPNPATTVEETAKRAYQFYKAFVVDGNPKLMFSLIDSVYIQHNTNYKSGPENIWNFFCRGNKIGTEERTSWCFDASTNMSYASYPNVDRWRWVDGCVHEHWDQGEKMPAKDKCYKLATSTT